MRQAEAIACTYCICSQRQIGGYSRRSPTPLGSISYDITVQDTSAPGVIHRKQLNNLLFLDRIRLAHLGTEAAVQTKAEDPCPLSISYFLLAGSAFCRVVAGGSSPTMQVEIGGHPKGIMSASQSELERCGVVRLDATWESSVSELWRKINLPDRHAEEHPGTILFIAFHGATSPQRVDQVSLYDLNRLVASCRHAERKLPRQFRQLRVQLGAGRIKP